MLIIGITLMIIGVSVGVLALFRVQQTKEFSLPRPLQTLDGTNYVLRLQETVVGKTDSGYVVIVYVRLENPNPFNVTLDRLSFVLSSQRRHYLPSITGTQSELIKLPAQGVLDREMFSFSVPDNAFARRVALLVDYKYRILIKDDVPFDGRLRPGYFRSFRRRNW
jgi:hypothetical protein